MSNHPFTRPLFWPFVLTWVCWGVATHANPGLALAPGVGATRGPGLPQAPQIFGPSLLAQGRHVYADLQRARAAALRQQATNLRVALGAWPQDKETAIRHLAKSRQILDRTPGGSALAAKANQLLDNPHLTREDLRGFVDDLQGHVRDRREAEAATYRRDAIGPR